MDHDSFPLLDIQGYYRPQGKVRCQDLHIFDPKPQQTKPGIKKPRKMETMCSPFQCVAVLHQGAKTEAGITWCLKIAVP